MKLLSVAAFAALAALIATSGVAQPPTRPAPAASAEAIIYRDANYRGPAVNVHAPQPNLGLAWTVGSMRLVSGRMQLCSLPNYLGACTTATASYPILSPLGIPGNRVRSMRPMASVTPPPPPAGFGPSLRGMSAEFFSQPSEYGRRVLSCPNGASTANCARATAEQFCKARGFNYVGNVRQQSANGQVYLVDVLCKTSAI